MTGQIVNEFFGWAPLAAFIVLLIVLYYATKGQSAIHSPMGKTYACAGCGRRGKHAQMVPATHEGAIIWRCGRCSTAH